MTGEPWRRGRLDVGERRWWNGSLGSDARDSYQRVAEAAAGR